MPQPVDLITNEIRRQLPKMDNITLDIVCDAMADKYAQGRFKRATGLIEEGVKLAKKLDKEKK